MRILFYPVKTLINYLTSYCAALLRMETKILAQ